MPTQRRIVRGYLLLAKPGPPTAGKQSKGKKAAANNIAQKIEEDRIEAASALMSRSAAKPCRGEDLWVESL